MRSALERRQQMLEYLSDHRYTTYSEMASEFGISRRTAMYDIDVLTCSAPIFTVQGNGGGIRVADGWYINRRYLRDEHESFLRELMDGLQPTAGNDKRNPACLCKTKSQQKWRKSIKFSFLLHRNMQFYARCRLFMKGQYPPFAAFAAEKEEK